MPWGAPSRLYVWRNATNDVTLSTKSVATYSFGTSTAYRIALVALHPAIAGDADMEGLVGRVFADRGMWGAVNALVLKTAERVLRGEKGPAVFELGTLMIDVGPYVTVPGAKVSVRGAQHKAALKKLDGDSGSVTTLVEGRGDDDEGGRDAESGGRV